MKLTDEQFSDVRMDATYTLKPKDGYSAHNPLEWERAIANAAATFGAHWALKNKNNKKELNRRL